MTTLRTGRCTEVMAGVLGHSLGCVLPHGHAGQHHDATTGAHWFVGQPPTWTTFFRRRTGFEGFAVEWSMWCLMVGAVLQNVGFILKLVTS